MILAFAGRRPGGDAFPEENVEAVARAVERTVSDLRPRWAVGSAAAGSDLLVADAALRAGARLELLLAGDRSRFRASSVADKGATWSAFFDDVVSRAGVTVAEVGREAGDEASYRAVTAAIADRAQALADAGEQVGLLAVASRQGAAASHTGELAGLAETSGWPVWWIDPLRPGAAPS